MPDLKTADVSLTSDLAKVFADLRAWLQTPIHQGTPTPLGITNALVMKGVISFFETFEALEGASPGAFPLIYLVSGVLAQATGEDLLTGTGSLVAVNQNLSEVNDLVLETASLGQPQKGNATLRFSRPAGEIRPASIILDLLDVHLTFESSYGAPPSVLLAGYAVDGSRAELAIGNIEVNSVI